MGDVGGMEQKRVTAKFRCADGHEWSARYLTAAEFYRAPDQRPACPDCGKGWVGANLSGLQGERVEL
jgi:hypothetical protein